MMVCYAKIRGHEVKCLNGQWVYVDDGSLVSEGWDKRACGFCNENHTPEGHDPCLGTLSGVSNACCGHGTEEKAYIQFTDGRKTIRGKKALEVAEKLKTHR